MLMKNIWIDDLKPDFLLYYNNSFHSIAFNWQLLLFFVCFFWVGGGSQVNLLKTQITSNTVTNQTGILRMSPYYNLTNPVLLLNMCFHTFLSEIILNRGFSITYTKTKEIQFLRGHGSELKHQGIETQTHWMDGRWGPCYHKLFSSFCNCSPGLVNWD